jgi:hypothetical protein
VAGNLARPKLVSVKMTLAIAGAGLAVFSLGWAIQKAAGRP